MNAADDTVRRLRELNGVLELALMHAGDALEIGDPRTPSREWFQELLRTAAKELTIAGRFPGRFGLFSDDELRVLSAQLFPVGGGDDSGERCDLSEEVDRELGRRAVHPA